MTDEPLPGPKRETLLNLKAMLPSFIEGMAKKRAVGRGVPAQVRRPKKVCKVCGLLFDHVMMKLTDETNIESSLCNPCQKQLDEGWTALVCAEKYAIVRAKALSDWAGQIKRVSPNVMEALEKQFGVQTKAKSNGHSDSQPPVQP
jgi:hypothetical protein